MLRWARAHPLLAVAVAAVAVRVVVVLGVWFAYGGSVFLDDIAYSRLAADMARRGAWTAQRGSLFDQTATFLLPLTAVYRVFGPVRLAGQLVAAAFAVGASVLTARVALERLHPPWALAAGLTVALLPSQVLFSSLVLKDAAVWAVWAALALAVALVGRGRGLGTVGKLVALVGLLVLMGHLREHSAILAAWAAVVAVWVGGRSHRVVVALALTGVAVALPWQMGFGPGGIDVVRHQSLAYLRARNAAGAGTAIVKVRPGVHTPDQVDPEATTGSNLAYLPRGLAAVLIGPLPWEIGRNPRLLMAASEDLVWFPLLGLAAFGIASSWRRRDVLVFPALAAAGLAVVYALSEGNIGTAYRHRSEVVWAIALLAAAGAQHLAERLHGFGAGHDGEAM